MQSRYWSEQTLIVTVDGPQGRHQKTIEKPFARIGSDGSSEVVLPDPSVPRRALYLHATESGVFCVELSSTGSSEDSHRGWLRPERTLTLGPYRIEARLAEAASAPDPSPPDLEAKGSLAAPCPTLAVSSGGRLIGRRPITRRLTLLGRHRNSTLRLVGRSVSAAHCIFYSDGDSLWVVDLLSSNGTHVEGRPIEAAELPPGAVVKLANVELRYLPPSDESQALEPHAGQENAAVTLKQDGGPSELTGQEPEEEPSQGEAEEESSAAQDEVEPPPGTQIDQRLAAMEAEAEAFRSQRQQWEAQQEREKTEQADRRSRLAEEAARLQAERAELESQREKLEAERQAEASRIEHEANQGPTTQPCGNGSAEHLPVAETDGPEPATTGLEGPVAHDAAEEDSVEEHTAEEDEEDEEDAVEEVAAEEDSVEEHTAEEEDPHEATDLMLERLVSFRRRESRWYRITNAVRRLFGRSD